MKRPVATLLTAGALLLLVPASAGAATVSVSFGTDLEVDAPAGQVNLVTIARSGNSYIVSDTGTPPVAVLPCAPFAPGVVACPATGITQIDVELDNLNDSTTIAPTVVGDFSLDVDVEGEAGADTLTGGPGVRSGLNGGDDGDFLNGGAKGDSLRGNDGNDVITGGSGPDFIRGGIGNDSATGGADDDQFSSEQNPDGADSFVGGPGTDHMSYSDRFSGVTVDTDGVADDGEACPGVGCEGDNVGASVEIIEGGSGGDLLAGNGVDNDLEGRAGPDTLRGGGGDDELSGGEDGDNLAGGGGDDELESSDGSDRVLGGAGDDEIFTNFFPDGPDFYSGGGGADVAHLTSVGNKRVDLDGRADDGVGCPGAGCEGDNVRADVEDLIGGDGRDIFIGNRRANDFIGDLGNDRLVGGGGPDGLFGEEGNDSLNGGGGIDSLSGDSGTDRLATRDGKRDEVFCGSSADRVRGDRRDRIARDCERVKRGKR